MSPVQHTITGSALSLSLDEERRIVREQLEGAGERIGRTLVKNGALRVTLVGLQAGGSLRPHKADGPITVQVLEGAIDFEAEGKRWALSSGALFSLEAGIVHGVSSREGGLFLLTVAMPSSRPVEARP